MKFTVSAKRTLTILLCINVFILSVFMFSALMTQNMEISTYNQNLLDRIHVDREVSLPTWYNQALLLLAAGLAGVIYKLHKKNKHRKYWLATAIIFTILSIDEGVSLHEMLMEPMQSLLHITGGYFYFAWVIPIGIVVLLLMAIFVRFFFSLPRSTRLLIAIAFILFIGGSVGMEMLGANYVSRINEGFGQQEHWQTVYTIYTGLEEFLEMTGIVVFIYALLEYIRIIIKPKTSFPISIAE